MPSNPWWIHIVMLLAAAVVGAAVPLQAGTNAQLARVVGHPLLATSISLTVSLVLALAVSIALRLPLPRPAAMLAAPAWVWFGGFYGFVFLVTSMVVAPRLGAAVFMVAVIGGQVIASLLIDRFALAGFEQKAITPWRLAGVAFIIAGIVLMQVAPGQSGAKASTAARPSGPPPA